VKVTLLSRGHPTRRVLLKAVVLVAALAAINPLVFRYYGRSLSLASQSLFAIINLALFVGFFSLQEWLDPKRETWGAVIERRFKMIMLSLALLLFCLAAFLFFRQ
jgi:hypothetical protein